MCFDDIKIKDQIGVIKQAGFDAVFNDWSRDFNAAEVMEEVARHGLLHHSFHAPFYGMDDLWHDEEGELAEKMTQDVLMCIDDCERYNTDIVICHAIIGMDNHSPNELGLVRIGRIIDYAAKKGITIAFENTEGEEYLRKIFERFGECNNVGFCFDSGHEMCYNAGLDMLGEFGKYLISTHLNDNLGMADPSDKTFLDDSHMLPFEGKGDWQGIADRLHRCGYNGALTFEINSRSKPGRNANERYEKMTFEEYVNAAYKRAAQFRSLYLGR